MDYTLFRGGRHPNSESGARRIVTPLEDLRWHWGSAYDISIDPAGRYVALPRGGSDRVLAAWSVAELRQKIRDDRRESRRPSQPAPSP